MTHHSLTQANGDEKVNTREKATTLAAYVRSLDDFQIKQVEEPYNHMGATITDAILQAGIRYDLCASSTLAWSMLDTRLPSLTGLTLHEGGTGSVVLKR